MVAIQPKLELEMTDTPELPDLPDPDVARAELAKVGVSRFDEAGRDAGEGRVWVELPEMCERVRGCMDGLSVMSGEYCMMGRGGAGVAVRGGRPLRYLGNLR